MDLQSKSAWISRQPWLGFLGKISLDCPGYIGLDFQARLAIFAQAFQTILAQTFQAILALIPGQIGQEFTGQILRSNWLRFLGHICPDFQGQIVLDFRVKSNRISRLD